ncbi:hypothetical protein D3C81_1361200 [compost metagenome]
MERSVVGGSSTGGGWRRGAGAIVIAARMAPVCVLAVFLRQIKNPQYAAPGHCPLHQIPTHSARHGNHPDPSFPAFALGQDTGRTAAARLRLVRAGVPAVLPGRRGLCRAGDRGMVGNACRDAVGRAGAGAARDVLARARDGVRLCRGDRGGLPVHGGARLDRPAHADRRRAGRAVPAVAGGTRGHVDGAGHRCLRRRRRIPAAGGAGVHAHAGQGRQPAQLPAGAGAVAARRGQYRRTVAAGRRA